MLLQLLDKLSILYINNKYGNIYYFNPPISIKIFSIKLFFLI